jgi:hypothetical protein
MPDFWQRLEPLDPELTEKAIALRDHVFGDGRLSRAPSPAWRLASPRTARPSRSLAI